MSIGRSQFASDVEYQQALRDHFATHAMQVCLAQCETFPDEHWRDGVAIDAYQMADAMLRVRSSTP